MEPTTTQLVQDSYDKIADAYLAWNTGQSSPREHFVARLLDLLADRAQPRVLDLGCGSGVPVTRMLLDRGASVVANDLSPRQIELTREQCPTATCVAGDMRTLTWAAASFDGVACFYALFHLPRAEQPVMLARVHTWLRPGGVLVMSMGTGDGEAMHGEFLGHGMFWSSFDAESNKKMVEDAGFELLESHVLEAGDSKLPESDPDYGVKFLWLVARKRGLP